MKTMILASLIVLITNIAQAANQAQRDLHMPVSKADGIESLARSNKTDIHYSFVAQWGFRTKELSVSERGLCYAVSAGNVALVTARHLGQDLSPLFKELGTSEAEFQKQSSEVAEFCERKE